MNDMIEGKLEKLENVITIRDNNGNFKLSKLMQENY